MKKIKKIGISIFLFFILFLVFLLVFILFLFIRKIPNRWKTGEESSQAQAASEANLLRVGVCKDLSRLSYYYENSDQYYGFEDDLAEKIAFSLDYDDVAFVGVDMDDRLEALDEGRIDCLIACVTWTEAREAVYDLSTPYLVDYGRIFIQKSTLFDDWEDLRGMKIGYRSHTVAKESFEAKLKEEGYIDSKQTIDDFCTMVEMANYDSLCEGVETGSLDAAAMDGCIALEYMDEDTVFLTEKYYSTDKFCVVTRKGDERSEEIDQAINSMFELGIIDKFKSKWGIDTSQISLTTDAVDSSDTSENQMDDINALDIGEDPTESDAEATSETSGNTQILIRDIFEEEDSEDSNSEDNDTADQSSSDENE